MRRIALIANPAARSGLAWAERARALLAEAGEAVSLHASDRPGGAVELARVRADEGSDIVAAVGGDGTIGEVVRGLLSASRPAALGILPAGTGNDTARGLGIPLRIEDAVRRLVSATPAPMDLSAVNGTPFLGIGVLGFPAGVGESVNAWKSGRRRWIARALGRQVYAWTCVRRLAAPAESAQAAIRCGGFAFEGPLFALLVGHHAGVRGSFLPLPDARRDDGLMDMCVVGAERAPGSKLNAGERALTLAGALSGRHTRLEWVHHLQSAEPLRVRLDRPMPFLGDGDELERGAELTVETLPAALAVVA